MATWKKIDSEGVVHFQFLCEACNSRKKPLLEKDNWTLVREGEPAACNDCELRCALTARGLWGAEDAIRYAVCDACPAYEKCELQGRYYC
ncbi:hypothetical protein KKG22_05960 [Patescibacteria group bacterium]|nr:hypothetical protein [Patescibacteria group bacterium]